MENSLLIIEFYEFMKYNDSNERHIVNNLQVILNFDKYFNLEKPIIRYILTVYSKSFIILLIFRFVFNSHYLKLLFLYKIRK